MELSRKSLGAVITVLLMVVAACGSAETSGEVVPPVEDTAPDPVAPDSRINLRYGTLTERSIDVDADGALMNAAVTGMNQFAVDLYSSIAAEEEANFVVGPYSVTSALSMLYAGAAGETEVEMAAVLHSLGGNDAWQEGLNAYDLTLDARTAGSPTVWAAANKVWTNPGLPLRDEYLDVLTGLYNSPLAEADFAGDPEGERQVINEWIGERTNGLIPELWPVGSFGPNTEMVVVNAVALDAPWEFPFDPSHTRSGEFFKTDGTSVSVPMMRYDEFLPSMWSEDVQAVELPYGGGALSMVVIVPSDLAAFEADLTIESLDSVVDQISEGGIHLSMPKWTSRTHRSLGDTLKALGMPSAFGNADFSGMTEGGGLFLGQVEHEAFIEVDEEGTRAAAATGGEMLGSHGPTVEVNRPFLYLIRDRGAGTILFIGRVTDPSS